MEKLGSSFSSSSTNTRRLQHEMWLENFLKQGFLKRQGFVLLFKSSLACPSLVLHYLSYKSSFWRKNYCFKLLESHFDFTGNKKFVFCVNNSQHATCKYTDRQWRAAKGEGILPSTEIQYAVVRLSKKTPY